jgi:hypothetical protein
MFGTSVAVDGLMTSVLVPLIEDVSQFIVELVELVVSVHSLVVTSSVDDSTETADKL